MTLVPRLVARARSVNPRDVDGLLALALTAWAVAQPGVLSDPGRGIVLVTMTMAVAWRRAAPLAVLAVEVAGVAILPTQVDLPQGVALLLAVYSAALYSDRRLVLALLLLATGAWLLAFGGQARIPSGLVPVLLVAPAWLAGTGLRHREQRAEASAARADRLEQEREAALRAERARIARELHDVVTHSVSVMVLQTGAARQIMTRDERRSRALLESVEASGRSALEELRRLLGLLSDQDADAPLSPQPGVAEIPALIKQLRDTGLDVEMSVEGQPRAVSGGVTIAAYRIVQEALTNVLKHAGRTPTQVVLRWADAALELEILDRGAQRPGAAQRPGGAQRPGHDRDTPAGRGISGMRERAAMYGGTLEANPGPHGGYLVRARLPLEDSAA